MNVISLNMVDGREILFKDEAMCIKFLTKANSASSFYPDIYSIRVISTDREIQECLDVLNLSNVVSINFKKE